MPDNENTPHPPAGGLLWVGAALALVITALAAGSYGTSGEITAAPGTPLYGKAVHEAIEGLAGRRAKPNAAGQPAAAHPPLPAGLSPADYYWCDKCKAYHKRPPAGGAAPAQPVPAAAPSPAANGQPAAAHPPLPAGLSPADYYWCDKCKAYHPRKPGGAGPAKDAAQPQAPPKIPPQPAPAQPQPKATPAE